MEVQCQLLLTACIVNFGVTSAQLHKHMIVTDKENDASKVQRNFQNLFDSIAKNNTKKSVNYDILKEEVSRERQAFDLMKEELQTMQMRNAQKKRRNFYEKNNINGNFVAVKREINENLGATHKTFDDETARLLLNKWRKDPKNPRALYNKLKLKPDYFLDINNLKIAGEDLNSRRVYASDVGPELVLLKHGYLSVKSGPEKPGGLYTLHFPDIRAQISLYVDMMAEAGMDDAQIGAALSKMETILEQIPPEVDDFKSFMLALETVVSRIPLRFQDWCIPAVFGALHMCGLNVTMGDTSIGHRSIHCEQLSDDARLRFTIDWENESARDAWDRNYKDLEQLELVLQPRKNILGAMITLSDERNNSHIRDWYGQFISPNGELIREYSPIGLIG